MDKEQHDFFFPPAAVATAGQVRLETCNRLETYGGEGDVTVAAARHLFRVAAGLESPLLGEMAIVSQVKNAYEEALRRGKLPAAINRLFQSALHTAHRCRLETAISRGAVSYPQVTVDMLCRTVPDLGDKVVSIIGVNDMTEAILNFLTARGATNIILANRSRDKADAMAARYGAEALPLTEKRRLLAVADVLISATSAPHTLIHRRDYLPDSRPQLIFDLANPADVDDDVRLLQGKTLYNIKEIERQAVQNRQRRQREIPRCEAIIEEEIAELMRWQQYRRTMMGAGAKTT